MSILEKNYILKYLFVFLLVGLVSCGDASGDASGDVENLTEVIFERYSNGNKKFVGYTIKGEVKEDFVKKVRYTEDGRKIDEINYRNGRREGKTYLYFIKSGNVNMEVTYKDGRVDGLFREWYENGQLYSEGNFKDDRLISAKCFDEDGNLIKCD